LGFRRQGQIRRRIAEIASPLLAMNHFSREEPAVAEQRVGKRYVAGGERGADPARGYGLAPFVGLGLDDGDAEAVGGARGAEEIRGSLTGAAEMEVVAGYGMDDAQSVAQDGVDEVLRFDRSK